MHNVPLTNYSEIAQSAAEL